MSSDPPLHHGLTGWDHTSHPDFLDYYEQQSLSPATLERFEKVCDKARTLLAGADGRTGMLQVLDVGCGAGTQARLWARLGHQVHGLDVNAPLIEVARQRAREEQLEIEFAIGSATDLPYADRSMDVCLLPELLEHVVDWQRCLDESARILKPGGLLYLSTTNWLCPLQDEFELPLYSWYPGFVKRRCERLALTTRPEMANHAKYPAVNWFSFYSLAAELDRRGFDCRDRFDLIDTEALGLLPRMAVKLARRLPPVRLAGHLATPSTVLFALKRHRD
ncbi:MAG: class I SAM-dependent methyltransferase [Candidatus Accumulibacter sp. UW26]|jgi:2-polyprenyl-3-methyl-5-hydroxy-6-metoxy-1,4-benzoquinol methylase